MLEAIELAAQDAKTSDASCAYIEHSSISSDLCLSPPHVLLIEDNVVALHLIEAMAKLAGLSHRSAVDGESALALAKSTEFDLIITDIGLPGISGYEFTYAFRQWEQEKGRTPIPIIGLTAHAMREAKQECLQSGMNNMLCKPINLVIMKELIKQYLPHAYSQTKPAPTLLHKDSFPLLDVSLGIKNIGCEITFRDMLQHMVVIEIPEARSELQHSYANNDWKTIEKITHKLKSGAIYCGTMKLQHTCQQLEQSFKSGHTHALSGLFYQLISVLEATQQGILDWLHDGV